MAQALRGFATSTTQVDELLLIKELAAAKDFKLSLDPSKHQLTSIKHLQAWFAGILVMLERFPNMQAFLFGTVAMIYQQSTEPTTPSHRHQVGKRSEG